MAILYPYTAPHRTASAFLGFLCSDEILELFLLALELCDRDLPRRRSLKRCHLLLTLLHEAIAENACNCTDRKTDPKI